MPSSRKLRATTSEPSGDGRHHRRQDPLRLARRLQIARDRDDDDAQDHRRLGLGDRDRALERAAEDQGQGKHDGAQQAEADAHAAVGLQRPGEDQRRVGDDRHQDRQADHQAAAQQGPQVMAIDAEKALDPAAGGSATIAWVGLGLGARIFRIGVQDRRAAGVG